MTKEEVILYGMIIESEGHRTTTQDEELLRKALFKAYGAKEDATEEELKTLQHELEQHTQAVVDNFREKARSFLEA